MPNHRDLRAGYFSINFNMTWYYQMIRDIESCVKFIAKTEEQQEKDKEDFDNYIEDCVDKYITYKVFNHIREEHIDEYENIWFYLEDKTKEYANNNKEAVRFYKEGETDEDYEGQLEEDDNKGQLEESDSQGR